MKINKIKRRVFSSSFVLLPSYKNYFFIFDKKNSYFNCVFSSILNIITEKHKYLIQLPYNPAYILQRNKILYGLLEKELEVTLKTAYKKYYSTDIKDRKKVLKKIATSNPLLK